MATSPHGQIHRALHARVRDLYALDTPEIVLEYPPRPEFGDLATPVAFDLARVLKRNPRRIASEIIEALPPVPGVARFSLAAGGYINIFFDRSTRARSLLEDLDRPRSPAPGGEKVIVEHTNINANKAAQVG
ncbi:MAG: arginine--tRNA ligase, partial [Acidobacteriota bacterium]